MKWWTLSKQKVPDIASWVREAAKLCGPVHVGTDSLNMGRHTQFVTVLAVLNPPHGGRAAYTREVVPRMASLRERLIREVWRSVDVALTIAPDVPGELSIHVDANPNPRYRSHQYVQELTAMVVSQGFRVVLKPDAWVAQSAADWVVRHLGRMPRAS